MVADDKALAMSFSTVEEVLMVGYPNGLVDEINNLPIFRRGITATHPAIDFNGKPLAAVDIACFPGSSGSPIVILSDGVRIRRSILLGVLTDGVTMDPSGTLEIHRLPALSQVQSPRPLVVLNLGYYTKASQIGALMQEAVKVFDSQPPEPTVAEVS